ncbi:MAG: ornithine racemase [Thermosediminibacterales bacterium]|nr:ornithine racemase [Thermosediminibacterales bacterium]
MKCPRIEVNLTKIKQNACYLKKMCQKNGIELMAVTKGFCAKHQIAKTLEEAGITRFGDSRVENIRKLREANIRGEMTLIRLPMLSEAVEVVKWADVSFNTEIEVIEALSREAVSQNKLHKIVLVIEVGDLREGIMPEKLVETIKYIRKLKGIEIYGVALNVGCFGGVLPSITNTQTLVEAAIKVEEMLGKDLKVISGGSTCSLKLLEEGKMPERINQLRIGEAILLGTDVTGQRKIPGLNRNTMRLVAEVVELKEKPSVPWGEIGRDAFGKLPKFEDKGIRKRAILAIGRQDVVIESLIPEIEGVKVLGGSSDHMILDVTDAQDDVYVGKQMGFKMSYGAMLALMTSEYVEKVYIDEDEGKTFKNIE